MALEPSTTRADAAALPLRGRARIETDRARSRAKLVPSRRSEASDRRKIEIGLRR